MKHCPLQSGLPAYRQAVAICLSQFFRGPKGHLPKTASYVATIAPPYRHSAKLQDIHNFMPI
jgi:hypothetical protein